tara:strand:+ start:388 stop:1353 length:966 start_codon:yes stop_codon:yes gene_type:complete
MAVRYKYPIVDEGDYYGRISFQAMIQPPADIQLINQGISFFASARNSYNNLSGEVSAGDDQKLAAITKPVQNALEGLDYTPIQPGKGQVSDGGKVTLYLPTTIQIQDGVLYDNTINLGLVGGSAEAGLAKGAGAVNAVAAGIKGGIENFRDLFRDGTGRDAARVAATRFAETVPMFGFGDEIGAAVKSQLRVTANPNTRTLFRSVPIRSFTFTFKLIPNSAHEAREIRAIIQWFREQLYPESIGPGGILGFKFPNKFHIRLSYKNQELGIKFLPAYITNFNATYNGAGGGFHADGSFTDAEITLSFTEERALTNQLVKGGY